MLEVKLKSILRVALFWSLILATRKLRDSHDPVLKTVCTPVDNPTSHRTASIIQDLVDTYKTWRAEGIAAPQIGFLDRIIIVKYMGVPLPMINPEIISMSEETDVEKEGCLSYPQFFVDIKRSTSIKVKFISPTGTLQEMEFKGWSARIVQHEVDHLNGICRVGDAFFAANPHSKPPKRFDPLPGF